jgi:hypothetical protein
MGFGTRQLPIRLRAARTIVYCQAAILVLTAVFALGIVMMGGQGAGFTLSGLAFRTSITGGGVATFALVYLAVASAVVVVEHQVAVRGDTARLALVAVEVALSVYLIGFVDAAPGGWIFGPAAGAAVLALHYWPELRLGSPATHSLTPAAPSPERHAPAGTGQDAATPPHL